MKSKLPLDIPAGEAHNELVTEIRIHTRTYNVSITKSTIIPDRISVSVEGYEEGRIGWVDKTTGGWTPVINRPGPTGLVLRSEKLRRDAVEELVWRWDRDWRIG